MEKVFHNKWWDYSDKPFNVRGYICLKFSVYWGLACTFIMDIVHPIIYHGIRLLPHMLGLILLCLFVGVFVVDCCITVATILKFNKRLKMMDELAVQIHKISDEIGENIYDSVTDIMEKSEEFQKTHPEIVDKFTETKENIRLTLNENVMEAKSEIEAKRTASDEKRKQREKLYREYKKLFDWKSFGFQRLMKAFPDMKSKESNEILDDFKKHFKIKHRDS